MTERVWMGLDRVTATGLACVVCARDFRVRGAPARVPVGRSYTGSQVFACVGQCVEEAVATPEVLAIPLDALTAGAVACLAVLEGDRGDWYRVDLDRLVAAIVQAGAPVVVAAELRRLAGLGTPGTSDIAASTLGAALRVTVAGFVGAGVLRARADELDPAGAAR